MDLKKIFRSFVLLAIVFILAFACVACSDSDEKQDASNSETVSDATDAEVVDKDGKYTIFENGEYVARIVFPENATEAEKALYDKVRNKMKELTGVMPERITDFKAYNDDGADRAKPAILIGKTNYDESVQVYQELGYTEHLMKIVGNKLVIAFSTDVEAGNLYASLLGYLREATKEYVGVKKDIKSSKSTNAFLSSLPKYPNDTYDLVDLDRNSYMIHMKKDSIDNMRAYCEKLVEFGFEKVESREECGNLFETFTFEDKYAYAYYRDFDKSVRVVLGPKKMLASANCDAGLEETYTPYIASIPQPNDGLGYIIRMPDGRFIILDGGYKGGDRVYNTLRELEEGKITIAAWFVSHPHGDHYPALVDFIKAHGNDEDVTVERVMFNYVHPDAYNINGSAGKENASNAVRSLYNDIQTGLPNTPIIKVHTGQTFSFGTSSVEILYTVEDIMPRTLPNLNDSSMVIRVNIGEQSIMLLADTCYDSGPILNNTWGEYLKSDIMQIAHHGCYPSVKAIYDSIQAETVLFPAMYKNVKNYVVEENWAEVMNAVLGYAKDIYVSGDHMEIIELPYVVKNNKEEMLEYIKNY